MKDSYKKYVNALAERSNNNQSCSQDPSAAVCAYLGLLQDISTSGSTQKPYVIQNPGGFLAQYTPTTQASGLNTVFDGAIAKLWSTAAAPNASDADDQHGRRPG